MLNRRIFLCAFVLTMLISCSASYQHIKNAEELEEAGLHEQAFDSYYLALLSDTENVDAINGLKTTGKLLLKSYGDELRYAYLKEEYLNVYSIYQDILDLKEKSSNHNIEFNIPFDLTSNFETSTNILAENYYKKGQTYFTNSEWDEAIREFERCTNYVKSYKDVEDLIQQAENNRDNEIAENYYQQGVEEYEQENYRRAYYHFEKIQSYRNNYKNTINLMSNCVKYGQTSIAIFPFDNFSGLQDLHNRLYTYTINYAVRNNSPFLNVIDRQNLQMLLNEQNLGLSGIIDEGTAARAGKLIGVKYVIMGKLLEVNNNQGNITQEEIEAFDLGKSGARVSFTLYEGESTALVKAQYQIISTETSQIVYSDIVEKSNSDYVKYAIYPKGNYKNLTFYPPATDETTMVLNLGVSLLSGGADIDKSLFTARRNLKNSNQMASESLQSIGQQIARSILSWANRN